MTIATVLSFIKDLFCGIGVGVVSVGLFTFIFNRERYK